MHSPEQQGAGGFWFLEAVSSPPGHGDPIYPPHSFPGREEEALGLVRERRVHSQGNLSDVLKSCDNHGMVPKILPN